MVKKEPSNLSTKLKAIETIVRELEKLAEEDRMDIIGFALKQVGIKVPQSDSTGATKEKLLAGGSESIDKFVSAKRPADQYQRVAALAYYLKHYRETNQFKNKDITSANLEAAQSRIGNMADVISKAETRYHFLTKGMDEGTRQLTTLGAEIVEALPSQEKVKEIIKSSKARRRKKPKKKSKQTK